MAIVFRWDSSADSWTFLTGSAPTYSSGGTWGERMVFPATTAITYARATATASAAHAVRCIYTLASYATSSHAIIGALDSTPAQVWRVEVGTNGFLRLRDAANTLVSTGATNPLLVGTEYRIEVERSGFNVTVKMYRVSDNALRETIGPIALATAPAVAFLNVGNSAPLTGTLGATTYDAVQMNNTTGEVGIPPSANAALAATASVSPTSGTPPYTQTVTLTATGGSGVYSYEMLDWGDGTSTPPQTSNVLSKTITAGTAAGSKSWTARVTG